tara:strand:- start:91 stop:1035 length:945 start_codon:yes stop_codon:yes gene_type:complete
MELTKKEIEEISKEYSLGKVISTKHITTGWSNFNFIFNTKKGKFIIQILGDKLDSWKKKRMNIQFKLLDYFKKNNFPYEVPKPLKNKKQKYLLKFGDKTLWVYEFVKGDSVKKINLEQFKEIAKTLAKYHKFVKNFKLKDNDFFDLNWQLEEYKKLKKIKPINKIDRLFLKNIPFFENCLKTLKKINFKQNMILTHSDFNSENVLFKKNKIVGIIDWESSQLAPLARDITIAIKRGNYMNKRLTKKKREIFLKEYEKINPLTKDEKKLISPIMIKENCGLFMWMYNGMKKKDHKKVETLLDIVKQTKKLLKDLE